MSLRRQSTSRTKEEAEEIWLNDATCKNFWDVDGVQDNSQLLQEVIDVLYNSFEGNNYEVDYVENQNGTRLIIQCKVCAKDLTSYDPFLTHENGKPHKKARQKQIAPLESNIRDGNLELKAHNTLRGTFAEGSLENQIDSSDSVVLGVQFVYKEILHGRETFTCQLCQKNVDAQQLSTSRMFMHLTSRGHNQRYLEAKFGFAKKTLSDYENEARNIEEFEGKIHTNIVDFTKQLSQDVSGAGTSQSSGSRNWSRSLSRSPPQNGIPSRVPVEKSPDHHDSKFAPEKSFKPASSASSDVGITVDMSAEALPILNVVNVMQEAECQEVLQEDADMQGLLVQTLWVLANKMEKHYHQTGATYNEDQSKTLLSVYAEKVKQYIIEFADS